MDIESRMARIEERLTWLQKHATEQDMAINSQSLEIKKLALALALLRKQVPDLAADSSERAEAEERPPHY